MSSTRDFNSPGIFAEDAATVIPPTPIAGVAYRDVTGGTVDTPNGWRYGTRVESQDWNQIMFLITSMIGMMDKQGVLGYSSSVDYGIPALAFGSNGLPYFCIQENGPSSSVHDPISSPLYWQQFGLRGMVVLTSSQTWDVPLAMSLGYIRPVITVIGGGGGGARSTSGIGPSGGGGGGISKAIVDLSGVSTVVATVGSGGSGGVADPSNGVNGGTSSFLALSATGGSGGVNISSSPLGGIGSGGEINTSLGSGQVALRNSTNTGFIGGAGGGGESAFGATGGATPSGFGQGGGGRSSTSGTSGAGGAIIIEW